MYFGKDADIQFICNLILDPKSASFSFLLLFSEGHVASLLKGS